MQCRVGVGVGVGNISVYHHFMRGRCLHYKPVSLYYCVYLFLTCIMFVCGLRFRLYDLCFTFAVGLVSFYVMKCCTTSNACVFVIFCCA